MNHVLFLILLSFVRSSQILFEGRTERSCAMLLKNATNFHHKTPLDLKKIAKQPDFLIFPSDLFLHLNEYFDYDSLKNFGYTCKTANEIKNFYISHRLDAFSKFYHFDEAWFNEIVFCIINEHFPMKDQALSSPQIHDHLQLMLLKYIYKECNFRQIPEYIYFGIVSFVHETVYGFEAFVPGCKEEWIYSFGNLIQKYDFPLSKEYFFDHENSCELSKQDLVVLEFLSTRPTILEQEAFKRSQRHFGFKLLFKDISLKKDNNDVIAEGEAKLIFREMITNRYFPENILNRINLSGSLHFWVKTELAESFKTWFIRFLHRKSGDPITNSLSYLWSRDLLNPFILEEIQAFPDFDARQMFLALLEVKMPFNIQISIMLKILKSGLLRLERFDSRVFEFALDNELPLFELIFTESPVIINLIDPDGNSDHLNLGDQKRFDLIFETQFDVNNPLALIFILGPKIKNYSSKIIQKFNLNVSYSFDGDFSNFACGVFTKAQLKSLNGKTLTFKQILRFLENKSICSFFGLKQKETKKEEESPQSFPVYSVKQFFENPNTIK